jgi:hypothetical protein
LEDTRLQADIAMAIIREMVSDRNSLLPGLEFSLPLKSESMLSSIRKGYSQMLIDVNEEEWPHFKPSGERIAHSRKSSDGHHLSPAISAPRSIPHTRPGKRHARGPKDTGITTK